MDSYNRGYDEGIEDLGGLGTKIGRATISTDSETTSSTKDSAQAADFYAAAYSYDGGTVISYRGTNTAPEGAMNLDIANGWATGGGDFRASQLEENSTS